MIMPISVGGKFLRGAEFDKGVTLTITAPPELVVCQNPKFGFQEGPNVGKTVRYFFKDATGDRIFDSKAIRFANAVSAYEVGDTIHIERHPAGTDTTYLAKRVTAPVNGGAVPVEEIPFQSL